MNTLFNKLNYKAHPSIFILNAPSSFNENLKDLNVDVHNNIKPKDKIEFVLGFAKTKEELNQLGKNIGLQLDGDAVCWIAYPKASSKKYKCDFNRDTGWEIMGEFGLEGVRQVAIDEDWSALRFRKVEYIKTLNRKFTLLSDAGKKRQK